jgi:hypothetical protein
MGGDGGGDGGGVGGGMFGIGKEMGESEIGNIMGVWGQKDMYLKFENGEEDAETHKYDPSGRRSRGTNISSKKAVRTESS